MFCGVCLLLAAKGGAQTTLYWTQGDNQWVRSTANFWSTTSGGAVNSPWIDGSAAVIESANPSLTLAPNDQAITVSTLTINNGLTLVGANLNTRILNITTGGSGDLTLATTSTEAAANGSFLRLSGTTAWDGTIATAGDGVASKNRIQVSATTAVGAGTKIRLAGLRIEFNGGANDSFTIGELQGTAGSVQLGTGSAGTKTLIVNQSGDTVFAGAFTKSGAAGTAVLTKQGAGELTLSGDNTLDRVNVDGGRLIVDGSISGAVTVNAGGYLAGTGSVGSVTLNSGAHIAYDLGASVHLTMSALTKGSAGIYTFDFGGTGEADVTYTLSSVAGAGFDTQDFAYTNLAEGLTGIFLLDGSTLTFSTAAIPEPSTHALLSGGVAAMAVVLAGRRRAK